MGSPSRITVLALRPGAAATSSGNISVIDSRFLEKMLTFLLSLWIWTRRPSYLGCTPTSPSFLITASGLGRRSASCGRSGGPDQTFRAARPVSPFSQSVCASRPRSEVRVGRLVFGNGVGGRERGDEQRLAEADLDRFEKGREAALDEVGDRLELVHVASAVDLGKNADQLVAAAGGLHQVEIGSKVSEFHTRSNHISAGMRSAQKGPLAPNVRKPQR